MDEIETVMNKLNDSEAEWWPFQFLRPAPEARLGLARSFALGILNGAPIGLAANILIVVAGKTVHPMLLPAMMTLVFFTLYAATLGHFWNRRAERLSLARQRRDQR